MTPDPSDGTCSHLDQVDPEAAPSGDGCVECLEGGGRWVHLRMCRSCGHVGCCDASARRHARAHSQATGHVLVSTFEPHEDWWWCYADEVGFQVPGLPSYAYP